MTENTVPDNIKNSLEYQTIALFYGDRRAHRSQVPLIEHINEGLSIMAERGASELAKKAYCLHPIVQNSEDVDVSKSEAFALTCEYRDRANSYLCRPENDRLTPEQIREQVGDMSQDCREMLWADKLQNRKDFKIYHAETHIRSKQLTQYFDNWINLLTTLEKFPNER